MSRAELELASHLLGDDRGHVGLGARKLLGDSGTDVVSQGVRKTAKELGRFDAHDSLQSPVRLAVAKRWVGHMS